MLTPQRYIEILKSRGRPLKDAGIDGHGLSKQDALEAVQSLVGSQVAISGGDVLRVEHGRPTYTYENWYADRRQGESVEDYLRRSWRIAGDFIRSYPDPQDGTILYSMVVAELGVPGSSYMT